MTIIFNSTKDHNNHYLKVAISKLNRLENIADKAKSLINKGYTANRDKNESLENIILRLISLEEKTQQIKNFISEDFENYEIINDFKGLTQFQKVEKLNAHLTSLEEEDFEHIKFFMNI